jgi:hypothetical protein
MISFKPGVDVAGIRPEIMLALLVAQGAYAPYDVIVTSVRDGKHSLTSLHYAGQAVDLRTRHVPDDQHQAIRDRLGDALTIDYDVLLEADHIHVEYQPRRRTP